jgi:hypothetical protein
MRLFVAAALRGLATAVSSPGRKRDPGRGT